MTKTQRNIVIIIVLALVAIGAFVYSAFFRGRTGVPDMSDDRIVSGGDSPTLPPLQGGGGGGGGTVPGGDLEVRSNVPQGDTFIIPTPEGGVTVKNVYKKQVDTDEGLVIFEVKENYQLAYRPDTGGFIINISEAPIGENWQKAEAALLAITGIAREDACKLDIVVMVQPSVAMELAGKTQPLSFCEGKVQ